MSDQQKKLTQHYAPHVLQPILAPELVSFFNTVAPQRSLLPLQCRHMTGDHPTPVACSPPGTTIGQLAERRIRQWVIQQEQDARQQQHKRLFGSAKP